VQRPAGAAPPRARRKIVDEPARRVGLRFDPGLVERLADDVIRLLPSPVPDTAAGTALPLLEFRPQPSVGGPPRRRPAAHGLRAERGLTGGLSQWPTPPWLVSLNDAILLARRVLIGLVHLGDERDGIPDSRRRRTVASLCASDDELPAVVRWCSTWRPASVVTGRGDGADDDTVELIHDALIREWPSLGMWVREERVSWSGCRTWSASGSAGGAPTASTASTTAGCCAAVTWRRPRTAAVPRPVAHPMPSATTSSAARGHGRPSRTGCGCAGGGQRQRAVAEAKLAASRIREQAQRVLTLVPLVPVTGLLVAVDGVIRNLRILPGTMVDAAQTSLHTALLASRERNRVAEHTARSRPSP